MLATASAVMLVISAKGFPLQMVFNAINGEAKQDTVAEIDAMFIACISTLESSIFVSGRIGVSVLTRPNTFKLLNRRAVIRVG